MAPVELWVAWGGRFVAPVEWIVAAEEFIVATGETVVADVRDNVLFLPFGLHR